MVPSQNGVKEPSGESQVVLRDQCLDGEDQLPLEAREVELKEDEGCVTKACHRGAT